MPESIGAFEEAVGRSAERETISSEWLEDTLSQWRAKAALPALGCIIVSREGVVARAVTGVRRLDANLTVSPDSRWQLGSITKPFLATLVAILVEEGKLHWDDSLAVLFPEHVSYMAPEVGRITIKNLLCHKSGLMRDGRAFMATEPGLSPTERRSRYVARIVKEPLLRSPGLQFSYSNVGYVILSAITERITGKPWGEIMRTRVLDPLGMKRALFFEPSLTAPETEPWPHKKASGKFVPAPKMNLDTDYLGYTNAGPGALSLSLDDFALWLRAHLTTDNFGGLLSKETASLLYRDEDKGGIPIFRHFVWPNGIGTDLSHGGTNGRNEAMHRIFRNHGIGYFLASNSRGLFELAAGDPGQLDDILIDKLFPGQWIHRPSTIVEPDAQGVMQGEYFDVISVEGGRVVYPADRRNSSGFNLLWGGARAGQKLVLRGKVAKAGRYAVMGTFVRNKDFGEAELSIGHLTLRQNFQANLWYWAPMELGTVNLPAGPFEMVTTALNDSGVGPVRFHLGLDFLHLTLL